MSDVAQKAALDFAEEFFEPLEAGPTDNWRRQEQAVERRGEAHRLSQALRPRFQALLDTAPEVYQQIARDNHASATRAWRLRDELTAAMADFREGILNDHAELGDSDKINAVLALFDDAMERACPATTS